MSKDTDIDSFRELVGEDIHELRDEHVAGPRQPRQDVDFDARRRAASGENLAGSATDPNMLTLGEVPRLEPWDEMAWKKDGVQEGVYRKLRLGRYAIEASLVPPCARRARRCSTSYVTPKGTAGGWC